MPGLVPGIHVLWRFKQVRRGWPGQGPAMTEEGSTRAPMPVDERRERLELLLDEAARRLVLHLAALLVDARRAGADEDLRLVQRQGVQEHHHLAQVILNAAAAQRAGRCRLNRDR